MAAVRHAFDIVEAMKAEGIYSHFSIYFPLWLRPKPDTPWLKGYDGQKTPFAALFFNKDFQKQYQRVVEGPAADAQPLDRQAADRRPGRRGPGNHQRRLVFLLDVQLRRDPRPRAAPARDPVRRLAEAEVRLDRRRARGPGAGRRSTATDPAEGRMGFRPLWNMFSEKTARDKDTARFLVESQRGFYRETYQFLRGLGFKGVITASNWITASPEVLGPLEKYTYTVGDFIDRHGYFGCRSRGRSIGVVDPRRPHLRRPQRASLRPRRARQAQGLRPPGDGPQLRRQALDDLGDDLEPAEPLSLGGPAVLRRLRRLAGQRRDRPLRARHGGRGR